MPWQYNGNGQWEEVYTNPSESNNNSRPPATSNIGSTNPPDLTDTSNKETTESTNNATSEFIEIEDNVLVGDLDVIPDPNYKAKSTVLLQYLGRNLTGLYFVDKVTHSFSNSGYLQTLSVSRNGFGATIKSGSANVSVDKVAPSQGGLMNGTSDSSRPPAYQPPVTKPPTEQKVVVNKWATVTPDIGLNIRTGNSLNHQIISAMPIGTRCFCKFKLSGWYEIEWGNIKGWSHGDYLRLD